MGHYGLQEGDYLEVELAENILLFRPVVQRFIPCFRKESVKSLNAAVTETAEQPDANSPTSEHRVVGERVRAKSVGQA
jgi:antitoxin component of MazEF toxin-antitoxin module